MAMVGRHRRFLDGGTRLGYRHHGAQALASASMSILAHTPRPPLVSASMVQTSSSAELSRRKTLHFYVAEDVSLWVSRCAFPLTGVLDVYMYNRHRILSAYAFRSLHPTERFVEPDTASFRFALQSPLLLGNVFLTVATSAVNLAPDHGCSPEIPHTHFFNIVIRRGARTPRAQDLKRGGKFGQGWTN
ncbi:hypothetical protein C8R45DRAFT_1222643 [Mycena sanguinolenta]|nr:hypothetical protein C8R45DRAFT_1222643 [Mycena sanguinolenta]